MGFGVATLVVILFVCAFLTPMSAPSAYSLSSLAGLLEMGIVYRAHPYHQRRP
jgi:hypothetical protein